LLKILFLSRNIFQNNGIWVTNTGKRVQLRDVFLPSLTEVERTILDKQAAEKIQQLGVTLTPQGEISNSCSRFSFSLSSNYFFHSQKHQIKVRKSLTSGEYCY
jgi:hypothetical protein